MANQNKIIHVDMDSFFASVELLDSPELKDLPIAVGGAADSRGVIATCNYIARNFGVHSAMATATALRLCPKLKIIKPNIEKYRTISKRLHAIFKRFTDKIEPLSLDEAYLDVTECSLHHGSATLIAENIRNIIFTEEKLTASAGVAPNKFLSKIASDWRKPNGLFVIKPDDIAGFITKLPVAKIPGVGKVTTAKLNNYGIFSCHDLQQYNLDTLTRVFGKFGDKLYSYARGIDVRNVEPIRIAKSVSVEETFNIDIKQENCQEQIPKLLVRLATRLSRKPERNIHKVFVKIKFADFTETTIEKIYPKLDLRISKILLIDGLARQPNTKVRLLGIGVRFTKPNSDGIQLMLPGVEDLLGDTS